MGFSLIVLFMMTSCGSVSRTGYAAPFERTEVHTDSIKVDFNLSQSKVEGKSSAWYILWFIRIGDRRYIEAANFKPTPSILGRRVDRVKSSAMYNALKTTNADILIYPQYDVQTKCYLFGLVEGYKVKASGYVGTIKRLYQLNDNYELPEKRYESAIPQENSRISEQRRSVISNHPQEYNSNKNSYSTDRNTSQLSNDRNETIETTYESNQISRPVGGEKAYNNYIEKNRNPLSKYDNCSVSHGKVILLFNVDKQGRPENINVFKSLCSAADSEAIRLLQNGPDWTPSNADTRLEINF